MKTPDRFVMLETPEGQAYIDLESIDCVGPAMSDSIGGRTVTMRLLYLRGGQGLAVLDCVENMAAIFATKGLTHA